MPEGKSQWQFLYQADVHMPETARLCLQCQLTCPLPAILSGILAGVMRSYHVCFGSKADIAPYSDQLIPTSKFIIKISGPPFFLIRRPPLPPKFILSKAPPPWQTLSCASKRLQETRTESSASFRWVGTGRVLWWLCESLRTLWASPIS